MVRFAVIFEKVPDPVYVSLEYEHRENPSLNPSSIAISALPLTDFAVADDAYRSNILLELLVGLDAEHLMYARTAVPSLKDLIVALYGPVTANILL